MAETVQSFITAMDALKLEQRAVDEIQPLVSELMSALTKVPGLPPGFEGSLCMFHLTEYVYIPDFNGWLLVPIGTTKMQSWLQKLNQMRAVEELSEDDARQLTHDLDCSYSAFHRYLSSQK